jgi:hypothetical protein
MKIRVASTTGVHAMTKTKRDMILRAVETITIQRGKVVYLDEEHVEKPLWDGLVAKGHLVEVGYLEGDRAFLDSTLPPGMGVIQPVTWEEIEAEGHKWHPRLFICEGIRHDGSRCRELVVGEENRGGPHLCAALRAGGFTV